MASTSGTKSDGLPRSLTKWMTRARTVVDNSEEEGDCETLIPSSLPEIVPILRAASELEPENPRVAYLCRFYAFEKAHKMDPMSFGRGVRQFKTNLLHRLEKEEQETRPQLAKTDPREIQKFYKMFYEEKVREGQYKRKVEEMARIYQIASVLYDVVRTVVLSEKVDEQINKYAREVERKKEQYVHSNILPLDATEAKPAIMELPEIKAAINALRKVDSLPKPRAQLIPDEPDNKDIAIHDLLDWLWLAFGFQKGNVANQREHLILLLSNADIRNKRQEDYVQLDDSTIENLMRKILKNYDSWCNHLHCEQNVNIPDNAPDRQQLQLLYTGLYLLIWGEASNIRFMPECICYIFHNMARELDWILHSNVSVSGGPFQPAHQGEEAFLREVVTPIYQVLHKEARRNQGGTVSHSKWRNYDDLNEYFWSDQCFKLGWPMDRKAEFFVHSDEIHPRNERPNNVTAGKRKLKTNFVEIRTFWHLYRSFDRLWVFFILAFQAMVIVAWSAGGSLLSLFDEDVFRKVMSVFITYSLLNFLQAMLDITLSCRAWGSLKYTQIVWYLLKFAVAAVWVVVIPIGYSSSVHNPMRHVRFFSDWIHNWQSQSFYNFAIIIFMMPNILAAILFILPPLRRSMQHSNLCIIVLIMWWAQPKLYVGSGLPEDLFSLLKYTLFWILLLISKLAFSYYVEILPIIGPTKLIMGLKVDNYVCDEFFPNVRHNIGVVISIWAPVVLLYFMDAQIWYAIFSTIIGVINGAFSHLGEIRTLGMLRSRFGSVPAAFTERLVPLPNKDVSRNPLDESLERRNIAKFSQVWNEFINCMRMEDLISNRERDLLLVPYSSSDVSVVRWPLFLLARKIPVALNMAKDFEGKSDINLFKKIANDGYMHSAVIECYETLRDILYGILVDDEDKMVIRHICDELDTSIQQHRFLNEFNMSELFNLSSKLERLLRLLKADPEDIESYKTQIIYVLQDIMEIITEDVMVNGHKIMERPRAKTEDNDGKEQKFGKINLGLMLSSSWMEKVVRLHLLLTVKESAINVPMNLEARRRITFFTNSLFMKMPNAPKVRNMLSFSVLTPYYKEDVLYSEEELNKENEDGISVLFYLQKIYPDEWSNFQERLNDLKTDDAAKDNKDLIRQWVSYRGQTLSRTVRGMMYYRQALELQCFLDMAEDNAHSKAVADMKFTYVVSCQIYGQQKKSCDPRDRSCYQNILDLMLQYPSLRVAYIDEREEGVNGKPEMVYYSVLLKGVDKFHEEIYRIKLPGPPTVIGEGKPENQNHAIIFTRGEALQTIDMNQDNYLEEAFKMRNVLEEFLKNHHGPEKPTILGLREHIFTGSVSSLAWFMSNQETSFVTIGQRTLANPLRVRFHYGHPDIFDRIFHLTRGGVSKASKTINLSEDIFSGFNSTLRGGYVTHHEYIQVGKGRDVGMNQISIFEAKVATGNGEQTLSRDVYRLGRHFDFYRMLSFYFTTVGFYFSSLVTVIIVYVFLYGRLYMVLSGLDLLDPIVQKSKSLEMALATQSFCQLGLLLVLPMVMEIGLERGFRTALGDLITMQLQLASVFFTFQLGTKAHHYGRTILHGGDKYRPTGQGFVVFHAKFAENYRLYSRSHFVKGLELLMLLIVYEAYRKSHRSLNIYWFITSSMWFLVASWLFAPFVFNPSGFVWQKTVDDWTGWKTWMGNRGGLGIPQDRSWESWWNSELEHLKHIDIQGRVLEIILACRFFIYQYGIVYHLNIAHNSHSLRVYGLSWLVMATLLLFLKMVTMGRRKFGTDFQLMFRILKFLLILVFSTVMTDLFVVFGLTIGDFFAAFLCFLPTGWALLLIGQACSSFMKGIGFWGAIMELARVYEYVMGFIIFMPIVILSWFPFVSEIQTRLLFNQAFSRGLQISMVLAGRKHKASSSPS